MNAPTALNPLADRMRPVTLDDIIGQEHIVGPGRLLRRAIAADRLSSLIFYGPPGTGKTSIARVIANTTKTHFESLNAVLSGVKDIRDAIERASERLKLYDKKTILFVDEVHRWNKAQQDALLPWVENGTIILIGATTENPFFEVNRALVSRSRVFQLLPLSADDLTRAALNAVRNREKGYGNWKILFEKDALKHLVEVASGDARSLLNALELAVETTPPSWPPPYDTEIRITMEAAEESIQRRAVLYDRDGDYHFDTISAFIKSVRGSDVDAALYWLARMVRAGEDPAFIFRRMVILASEDVGMADPHALSVVLSCAQSFERIGFPEGNYPLAHACIYLATAPKSNSAMAFFDALREVEKEDAEIPNHLRDSSRDKESFGHGEGYLYPHAWREHWTAQQYLPSPLQGKVFYNPSEIGYEGKIRDSIIKKKEMQISVLLNENYTKMRTDEEFLSWSPLSKGREAWFKRLESGKSRLFLSSKDALFALAAPLRHHRVLILHAGDGILLWEAARRTPEGLAAVCVNTALEEDTLRRFADHAYLDENEKPLIGVYDGAKIPAQEDARKLFACDSFDRIIGYEPWRHFYSRAEPDAPTLFRRCAAAFKPLLAKDGSLCFLQSPPVLGERLSRILAEDCAAEKDLAARLRMAEDAFFAQDGILSWNSETLIGAWESAGYTTEASVLHQEEERLVTESDIDHWFDPEKSRWGKCIAAYFDESEFQKMKALLHSRAERGPLLWKWQALLTRHAV